MALTAEQSAELRRGGSPATAVPFFRQENCSGLCVSVWMPAMISTPMKISKQRDREPQIFFVSGEGDCETKQSGSFGTKNWAAINALQKVSSVPIVSSSASGVEGFPFSAWFKPGFVPPSSVLGPYSSSPLPTSFTTTSPIQQPVIQSAPNSPPVDHSSPSLATTSLPFTPSHPPSAEHHLPSSSSLHSSPLPTSSDFVVSASSPPSDQPTTSTIHVPLPHTTNSHSMVTR
ncbi:hypothetical protein MRB53_022211 [Persea americana]|uniref:Uncharacterized protein n=1 Tax=Persea americana TaxID=3435 RepID=A0ACC2L767_PERAE|nr:hypothetical protein MRB53_022211 [Persea americana]